MPELHRMIVGPVITEKSSAAYQARKEYAFHVHAAATKPQIRTAIEALFKVTVTDVRTMVVRAKRRTGDRKSTRLNSSHGYISYAVFCLKKKKTYMCRKLR